MNSFPLLFSFRDLIAGRGWVADVAADGRVLLTEEEDGFWMYGVNPGGVAGGGKVRAEAFHEFRQGYRSVLFDIASETESFEAFRREVVDFFYSVNCSNAEEWDTARERVRRGCVESDLPKVVEERPPSVTVTQVVERSSTPDANVLNDDFDVAA